MPLLGRRYGTGGSLQSYYRLKRPFLEGCSVNEEKEWRQIAEEFARNSVSVPTYCRRVQLKHAAQLPIYSVGAVDIVIAE